MRFVLFCHSLRSDWNHGNAHFLRGIASELVARGHDVVVYEPRDAWSRVNLKREVLGEAALQSFRRNYPELESRLYDAESLDLDNVLADAQVVIVHEWNEHELVRRIGEHRRSHPSYALFFHDTHHRGVTAPYSMAAYELSAYDGVLAFGAVLRDLYVARGWAKRAWVWHEAADVRRFKPGDRRRLDTDLVWIGNWGDDERTAELREFLLGPVNELGLSATVYGVRYPEAALRELTVNGLNYLGFLPNSEVPDVFARARCTVHVPRGPYVAKLPGIPTIRVFEALACGIPLVCAPWHDREGLFTPGEDYLVAASGGAMVQALRELLNDPGRAEALAAHGRRTIEQRHTCAHRVDELLEIVGRLGSEGADLRTRRIG
jgi:spore maturation protein CgeB